ncbi:MAG: hypothetical protein M3N95_07865 [Actinomycetota bacterium]|nr:hypothetical protein [Actinomycetota bacterium]
MTGFDSAVGAGAGAAVALGAFVYNVAKDAGSRNFDVPAHTADTGAASIPESWADGRLESFGTATLSGLWYTHTRFWWIGRDRHPAPEPGRTPAKLAQHVDNTYVCTIFPFAIKWDMMKVDYDVADKRFQDNAMTITQKMVELEKETAQIHDQYQRALKNHQQALKLKMRQQDGELSEVKLQEDDDDDKELAEIQTRYKNALAVLASKREAVKRSQDADQAVQNLKVKHAGDKQPGLLYMRNARFVALPSFEGKARYGAPLVYVRGDVTLTSRLVSDKDQGRIDIAFNWHEWLPGYNHQWPESMTVHADGSITDITDKLKGRFGRTAKLDVQLAGEAPAPVSLAEFGHAGEVQDLRDFVEESRTERFSGQFKDNYATRKKAADDVLSSVGDYGKTAQRFRAAPEAKLGYFASRKPAPELQLLIPEGEEGEEEGWEVDRDEKDESLVPRKARERPPRLKDGEELRRFQEQLGPPSASDQELLADVKAQPKRVESETETT